ncbi:hypothetical protein V1523DRAFT_444694 [Lipomyces doorenjongii]
MTNNEPPSPESQPNPPNGGQSDDPYEAPNEHAGNHAPAVTLRDPYYSLPEGIVEMPTNYQDVEEPENPYLTDEQFFDPNADWERPFKDYTPQASQVELVPGGLQDCHSSIQTIILLKAATTTPTSAMPRPLFSSEPKDEEGESPYEDQGNPFRNSIPASVPSFELVTSPQASTTQRWRCDLIVRSRGASHLFRAGFLLPSQQDRCPNLNDLRQAI